MSIDETQVEKAPTEAVDEQTSEKVEDKEDNTATENGENESENKEKEDDNDNDGDDEEDDEEEGKTSKTRTPRKKADISMEPVRSSTRERKTVTRINMAPEQKEEKILEFAEGDGEKLGDIENVEKRLGMTKAKEGFLKKLYNVMFPGFRGKLATLKKDIRQFNGWGEGQYTPAVETKIKNIPTPDLKNICLLLDLEVGGTKTAIIERVTEFLKKPESSGKDFRLKTKGKKTPAKKTSTKKRKTSTKKDSKKKTKKSKKDDDEEDTSPKKKAKKAKKAKKEKVEESSSDDDEPLAKPSLSGDMKAAIKEMVENGNLEELSIKKIRNSLNEKFDEDVVSSKKKLIKEYTSELISEMNN